MAVIAGKMIKLEINRDPRILIPITTIIAVRRDRSNVYRSVFMPVALENAGSNVVIYI